MGHTHKVCNGSQSHKSTKYCIDLDRICQDSEFKTEDGVCQRLSPPCDGQDTWESQPPTNTSDRVCTSTTECSPYKEYIPPTVISDRSCIGVVAFLLLDTNKDLQPSEDATVLPVAVLLAFKAVVPGISSEQLISVDPQRFDGGMLVQVAVAATEAIPLLLDALARNAIVVQVKDFRAQRCLIVVLA